MFVCLLNVSKIEKKAINRPVDRAYKTQNPVYPSANFHYCPVYLLTFAYSNGHSANDLHVADAIAPKITLYYIPPVNGIVFNVAS